SHRGLGRPHRPSHGQHCCRHDPADRPDHPETPRPRPQRAAVGADRAHSSAPVGRLKDTSCPLVARRSTPSAPHQLELTVQSSQTTLRASTFGCALMRKLLFSVFLTVMALALTIGPALADGVGPTP